MSDPYLGVDEAGKGPVLGPMIAAAVFADPAFLPDAIDDSKRIAPARRERLAGEIRDHPEIVIGVGIVEPTEIDDPTTDMNTLTVLVQARAIAEALSCAAESAHVDIEAPSSASEPSLQAVADAGDVSEDRFARRLGDAIDSLGWSEEKSGSVPVPDPGIDVTARHGADAQDVVVGAASIVAKVERDRRMEAIGTDYPAYDGIGSGYPGDPTTTAFLDAYVEDTGDVPDCARRSWATCERLLEVRKQTGLDEFSR